VYAQKRRAARTSPELRDPLLSKASGPCLQPEPNRECEVNMTKEQRAKVRKAMRDLKKQGLEFDHLATCPDTYEIYLKVKFNY
jgi:hypothetical protein